ncbi:MAG TPA: hypothetical protein VGV35_06415 [Bryobacteraceae bacterium]|nr:hypothetical protein [Bryobacteraceae bacterium]
MLRQIHIYLGLLSFSHLIVYGIAGLTADAQQKLERPKVAASARYQPFLVPTNLTDKQVADAVYDRLKLPLTRPMPDWFLKHTAENDLRLDFVNINGIYRVTVLEKEQRLKIEEIRNSSWLFLEDIHAGTARNNEGLTLLRLWGFYNEFAMWSLLAMALTGTYLWLSSRPRLRWAQLCLAASAAAFAAFYFLIR